MIKRKFILLTALIISMTPLMAQTDDELFGKAPITDKKLWENREGHALLKDTYVAYDKMAAAAAKDGVNLYIVSAYRSFERQKGIWERKWNAPRLANNSAKGRALDILRYSSMPSTSRHHWGTDFDLVSVQPSYFESGNGKKIYDWLQKNAHKFLFYQPYTADRTSGYAEEKWHWSYYPISHRYEQTFIERVKNEDIKGFIGSGIAAEIDVINGWVKITTAETIKKMESIIESQSEGNNKRDILR